jgi:hypothetical protein
MTTQPKTSLVAADRAALNFPAVAEYRRLSRQIPKARERYYRVHQQTINVTNLYFEKSEHRDTVVRLRREIRMATRGTPATIAQDSITAAGYVSFGTEQLYNAEQHLVTSAYRMVRKLVHPDFNGGDRELFQLVNTAYRLRDLTFLQETYIMLVHDHDLFWCATKGLAYARQELERPKVSLRVLQSTPEFDIVRAHNMGNHSGARILADARISELVVILNAELQHLLNPSSSNGVNSEDQHRNREEQRDQKEASTSGRIEADTDSESAASTSSKQSEWEDWHSNC